MLKEFGGIPSLNQFDFAHVNTTGGKQGPDIETILKGQDLHAYSPALAL